MGKADRIACRMNWATCCSPWSTWAAAGMDAEQTLSRYNENAFRTMEDALYASGQRHAGVSLERLEALWDSEGSRKNLTGAGGLNRAAGKGPGNKSTWRCLLRRGLVVFECGRTGGRLCGETGDQQNEIAFVSESQELAIGRKTTRPIASTRWRLCGRAGPDALREIGRRALGEGQATASCRTNSTSSMIPRRTPGAARRQDIDQPWPAGRAAQRGRTGCSAGAPRSAQRRATVRSRWNGGIPAGGRWSLPVLR